MIDRGGVANMMSCNVYECNAEFVPRVPIADLSTYSRLAENSFCIMFSGRWLFYPRECNADRLQGLPKHRIGLGTPRTP